MKYFLLLFFTALLNLGCGSSMKPRTEAVPTTFSITVKNSGLLGGSTRGDTATELNDQLIELRMGVPVSKGSKSQLAIKVEITGTNFTKATAYNWQLIEVSTGSVLASKTESATFGAGGSTIANSVLKGISHLDLAAYASDQNRANLPKVIEQPKVTTFPKSQTDGANDYAIIIGIEKYRNEITPAIHAANDAESVKQLFEKTFNIPAQNIKTLVNERASKTDIMGALFEWLPKNVQSSQGRVFIFFSGHGAPNPTNGDAYLLPYDADPAYLKTGGILVSDVQKGLANLKTKHTYLFLDSCFSGSGPRSVLAKGTRPLVPVNDVKSEGTITLTASAANQTTGMHDKAKNGLFTHYLIEALSGKSDGNSDTSISLAEVSKYVSKHVGDDARRQNREQSTSLKTPKGLDTNDKILVQSLGN